MDQSNHLTEMEGTQVGENMIKLRDRVEVIEQQGQIGLKAGTL